VELIVVIVILAILAAIAIPALTGYIAKAEDKEWEMKARDAAVAMRAVFDEAYANGTLGAKLTDSNRNLFTGIAYPGNPSLKGYDINALSESDNNGDGSYYRKKQFDLLGLPYIASTAAPGFWILPGCFADASSDCTILDAPAWYYYYFPGGYGPTNGDYEMVLVSYGLDGVPVGSVSTYAEYVDSLITGSGNGRCDPSAGYRVYHLTRSYPW
jgi:type II secretory pathway pseudopilin PulG